MENLTVTEWLKENQLTDKEIDFVLTFIPALSTLSVDKTKAPHVLNMLNSHFPAFLISENVDYLLFENLDSLLQEYLKAKISTEELLKRMSEQGICKPVSDSILATVK